MEALAKRKSEEARALAERLTVALFALGPFALGCSYHCDDPLISAPYVCS